MKYRNKEEMQENIDVLGMCTLSKFSAISHLSKLQIPLDGMIALESQIREIECGLWTLVPLGLGNDIATFENQIQHIQKKCNVFIEAAKAMRAVKAEL
jgi:hypothetical protein